MGVARLLPGLAAVAAIAAAAALLARLMPVVGMPVLALALGALAGSVRRPAAPMQPGVAFAARSVLQAAIVLSGFGVSAQAVLRTGWTTLPVTLTTIAVALIAAPLAGRRLHVEPDATALIGVGTAICGASAIGALAAVLEPEAAVMALAIGVIFAYNVAAVLLFPPLGHLMHLTQQAFGVWAGTAVNDTSSVVAAGYAYGVPAGIEATIVKLARAMLILPIVAGFAAWRAYRERTPEVPIAWRRIVPWFIVWFVAAAGVNSAGLVPAAGHPLLAQTAIVLIAAALAAIGLQVDVRRFAGAGARPLALGFALWVLVAVTSLVVQRLTGLA